MGNGASKKRHGVLFISHDNKVKFCSLCYFLLNCNIYYISTYHVQVHRIVFDRGTTARDLQEQLAVAVGLNRLLCYELQIDFNSQIAMLSPDCRMLC